jgi:hypothetical protein
LVQSHQGNAEALACDVSRREGEKVTKGLFKGHHGMKAHHWGKVIITIEPSSFEIEAMISSGIANLNFAQ